LLSIDARQWEDEMDSVAEYLNGYGDRLPDDLRQEQRQVAEALRQIS
jgi:GTP-dependent phosphoenolpyruvate carboxykinase